MFVSCPCSSAEQNRAPPRPLWERAVSLGEPRVSLAKPGEGYPVGRLDARLAMRAAPARARRGVLAGNGSRVYPTSALNLLGTRAGPSSAGFVARSARRRTGHPSPGFPSPICEGQIGEIRPPPQGGRWGLWPQSEST